MMFEVIPGRVDLLLYACMTMHDYFDENYFSCCINKGLKVCGNTSDNKVICEIINLNNLMKTLSAKTNKCSLANFNVFTTIIKAEDVT